MRRHKPKETGWARCNTFNDSVVSVTSLGTPHVSQFNWTWEDGYVDTDADDEVEDEYDQDEKTHEEEDETHTAEQDAVTIATSEDTTTIAVAEDI